VNNDAKDIIGRLRATNVLLLLLHVEEFTFLLDDTLRSLLDEYRPLFQRMTDLVSGLANFGDMKSELLSSIDDVLDPHSNTYYTRDYLDMLLSLYGGRKDVEQMHYENVPAIRATGQNSVVQWKMSILARVYGKRPEFCPVALRNRVATFISLNVCELLQSVMWVRIEFYSCYPRVALLPLEEGWSAFCKIVCDVGGGSRSFDPQSLAVSSLRSWQFSDIVRASLEKRQDDMPNKEAFAKAVIEVDEVMKVV
jgi:hypothetical protein